MEDIVIQDRELQRAMAKASLRRDWQHANESGIDKITDEAIEAEIAIVRAERLARWRATSDEPR
jgi:hypothetical protein